MRSLALLLGCVLLLSPISAEENPAPSYDKDILPILRANCLGCHQGPTGKGGLQLGNIQSLVNGGHTGPVVVPGKSAQSYLFHLVARGNMPPQPDRQLKEVEVEVIRAWIDGGLRADASYKVPPINDAISDDDRQHWAYQSLAQPSLPDRDLELQESGAIDLFIRRTRQAAGLEQAPPAARRTLLRRLYLDLLGIPPLRPSRRPSSRTPTRLLTTTSSIACSPRPNTVSAGAVTGWTLLAIPTPSDLTTSRHR